MSQVQQMLSSNVIRPSNSPWASPVVMVRKKDGSLRFCVDFRQLNAATVKDAHPLPRIDDLLDTLRGANWFSTLDLKSGYWQVPITEQDKAKTAFRTSSGQLFEFNQVPFGLCNAPATFSHLMDRVLAGLHWERCLFYLDDIIVLSSTWEEHLARLREVFERLRHAKLKLGAAKCTFATKEVSYLGHRVTEEGLLPDPSLLAAIRDIPPPKTTTEVRSFLGLAGYYWRYVKGFAAIAAPLHALTRKDAVFHWSEDCQNAFDQLKTLLTTSPITAFPDFSQEFRLYTDASTAGLCAILAQVQDGKERIICCASRALNKAEKSYPATKLECLAIVWAVAKFCPYLMAMPFEVYAVHYALQWLKTMRTGSALLHRWSAALEEYNFTVRHRPGKVQTHVDGLSRLPVGPAPPEDTLLHVQVDSEEEARRLAQELHTATHLGGQALWKLFSDRYSHKAGRRICIEVAQSCPQCQRGNDYGHRLKTTGTIQSKGPWDTLSVDIVGPLPADRRHEFVIVFVDCFSRYSILVPASNYTANTVSDALLRHVVPYFGTPRHLLSDRGREFVGEVWASLTRSLGIQRLLTSPYHPEGNSINERSHRTINNMLWARLLEGVPSRHWVDKIPSIMLALNAMAHEPHGFSASMIATGREPTLPPDLESDACASPYPEDPASYVEAVRQRLMLSHQQMTPPPAPVATNPYHEGSLNFVMTTPPERSNKLAPRWKGPFFVKRIPNPYQVTYEDGLVWRTIHVNHAKPAKTPVDGFPAPLSTPEPPLPPLGYLPRSLQRPQTRQSPPLPQSAAPTAGPNQPASPPATTPPSSRHATRSAANENSAPHAECRPPAAPGRTNRNSGMGQPLRHSARLNGLHYFLARQGRRVVLRGGNITVPYYDSHLNWVHDTSPPPSHRLEQTDTVPHSEPRENSRNSVPRNILDPIPSASRGNNSTASRGNISRASRDDVSSASHKKNSSAPHPDNSVHSPSQRGSQRKNNENKMSATATRSPLAVPLSPAPPKKCRIRRRRQAQRAANRNSGIIPAAPLTQDARWANQRAAGHAGATQTQPEGSDPTSTRRMAVYPPCRIVGNSGTNENSPFQIGLESSRNLGLYKLTIPDTQQDTQAGTLRVKNSGSGTSSPPYLLPRAGTAGIVYPLMPRAHRPDTSVTVDAALPEPVAFQRQIQPPTVVEIGSSVPRQTSLTPRRRAPRKPSRKRRLNRSTAVFRPVKRSPPRGHWCD